MGRNLQWHRAVSLRLCNSMALVGFVSLSFKHFKMRKNARKCIAVKPILEKFWDGKGALPLLRPPLGTPAEVVSTLSYTLFSPFRRL